MATHPGSYGDETLGDRGERADARSITSEPLPKPVSGRVQTGLLAATSQPAASLPHHLHDHSLVALAVELGVEDPLPRAEIEFARGHGNNDFMMDEQ